VRVLIASNPMFGHFMPLVPLATALSAGGHEVVVATEPGFLDRVRSHGLDGVAVGRDLTLDDVLGVLPDIFEVAPEDQDAYARPRMFVELRANNVLDDLLASVSEWQPDLIIRETGEFASWAVAERLAIPHVTVNVGAGGSAEQWDGWAGPWFRDLGLRLGLDELTASSLYRYGLVSFEPAGYYDWSATPTAVVFRPAPIATGPITDAAIAALDDRPLIYVTLGTEFYDADLMRSILEALRGGDWNVVATTGPGGVPAEVDPRVPDVVVASWVPHDAIVDRASLVISHAGAGTIAGCLVRGVPVVCVPRGADQFHHANRVEELGAGLSLGADSRSPAEIRAAVDEVLGAPRYRRAAGRVAADTARLPDVEQAVAHLEDLVAGLRAGAT